MKESFFTIENHYEILNGLHQIKVSTLDTCNKNEDFILTELLKTIIPELEYEIYYLPSEKGSYKSIKKFLIKDIKNQSLTGSVFILLPFIYQTFIQNPQLSPEQKFNECVKILKEKDYIPADNSLLNACNSIAILKAKNDLVTKLIIDKEITSYDISIKDSVGNILYDKNISRENFKNLIEDIDNETEFNAIGLKGNIELARPFILKQVQYGKGATWDGIYWGKDIIDKNEKKILSNGESIDFYMQDNEYKNKILTKDVKFESGNNIRAIFDISSKYDPYKGEYKTPVIKVKYVEAQDDNLVLHKKTYEEYLEKNKIENSNKNQGSLFDESIN